MGAADAETKAYLSNADRFADVFNFWIYHGDEVIKSGDLRELDTTDERLLSLVPDYRLNLLSPEKIDEPDFDKFRTGIGAVMQFIKHRRDKSVEWLSSNKRFEAIDRDSANLIKTVTGANIRFEEKGASVNMWEAWENSMKQAESKGKEEGREEGRAEGRAEGRVQSIRKMMQKLNLTAKQAMDILDIPVAERAKYAAQV